jgi:hypothetical protein
VFPEEIDIWISTLSKKAQPFQRGWRLGRSRIKRQQKGEFSLSVELVILRLNTITPKFRLNYIIGLQMATWGLLASIIVWDNSHNKSVYVCVHMCISYLFCFSGEPWPLQGKFYESMWQLSIAIVILKLDATGDRNSKSSRSCQSHSGTFTTDASSYLSQQVIQGRCRNESLLDSDMSLTWSKSLERVETHFFISSHWWDMAKSSRPTMFLTAWSLGSI